MSNCFKILTVMPLMPASSLVTLIPLQWEATFLNFI